MTLKLWAVSVRRRRLSTEVSWTPSLSGVSATTCTRVPTAADCYHRNPPQNVTGNHLPHAEFFIFLALCTFGLHLIDSPYLYIYSILFIFVLSPTLYCNCCTISHKFYLISHHLIQYRPLTHIEKYSTFCKCENN